MTPVTYHKILSLRQKDVYRVSLKSRTTFINQLLEVYTKITQLFIRYSVIVKNKKEDETLL